MFGRALAKVAAAMPCSVKRTFRRLKSAYISVIQLGKSVVPVETAPAAFGSASAGMIAIPASQTTYPINTTAAPADSELLIQQMTDNLGLLSSLTRSSSTNNSIQSTRSAGTSFTLTLKLCGKCDVHQILDRQLNFR